MCLLKYYIIYIYVCAGYVHLFANNEHAVFSGLDLTTEFADHVSHWSKKPHVSQSFQLTSNYKVFGCVFFTTF